MKQTAVEFIIDQLDCLNKERKDKLIDAETYFKNKKALIEQAKEMEKQQIIDANWEASEDTERAEEYYNETFKK